MLLAKANHYSLILKFMIMKTKDNEKKVRMNLPIRSAREMETIVDAEVELSERRKRCTATLTKSVERYYSGLLADVTTYVDGLPFQVKRVSAYSDWQYRMNLHPEDYLMCVLINLWCDEPSRSLFVECKMPMAWIRRCGLPTEIRLDDITWNWREYPDDAIWPVLDYDPKQDAFVPSVRGKSRSYGEWIRESDKVRKNNRTQISKLLNDKNDKESNERK